LKIYCGLAITNSLGSGWLKLVLTAETDPTIFFLLINGKYNALQVLQYGSQCKHSMSIVWSIIQWVYVHNTI
jgi:hypothetical protein